jgi:hypothetical protein
MANHYAVQGIRQTITTATQAIIVLRAPLAGTITRIDLWSAVAVSGDAVFDLRKNGTSVFADPNARPKIASGATGGSATNLSISVQRGDVLTLDLVQCPTNGVAAPAFASLTIDDGAASGGGIIVQDEGTSLPARGKINFTGAGVTATDDATNDRINVQISGGGGSAYSRYDPDARPGSPSAYDDEFDASTLDSKWSLYRPDSNSPFNAPLMLASQSLVRLGARGNFSSGGNDATWSGIVQAAPSSGDWAFRTKVFCPTPLPVETSGFEIPEMLAGLIAVMSDNSIIALAVRSGYNAAYEFSVRAERWSSPTTFGNEIIRTSFGLQIMPLYLEINKQGTTLTFRFSTDNLSWSYSYQWRYSVGALTIAQIGIGARFNASNSRANYSSANPPVAYFDWFRRVS